MLSVGSGVYAAEEEIHVPDSIEILENSDFLSEELNNVDIINNEISPQSSTVVYEANGYAGSPRGMRIGYNDKYMLFHNTSVQIPDGVNQTYTWERTVTKTSSSSNAFESGARAQGGVKFITELEGHINNTYTKSKTVTITQGTKSQTSITKAGYYELNFYLKANIYDMYGSWWGYTVDQPNVRKKIDRYLGQVYEATDFMHLAVTKR